jgi:hypothetical protein
MEKQAMSTFCSNLYSFSMYFVGNPLLVSVLKIFL